MSINKLKLNSKKKDHSKGSLSKQQKLRQLNGELMESLNKQQNNSNHKSNQKKHNIINMMAGSYQTIDRNFFSLNKNNTFQGSQTERVRKFQKLEYPISHMNNKVARFQYQNDESKSMTYDQSQINSSSASQLLDSLNLQIQKQGKTNKQLQKNKKKPVIKTITINQTGNNQVEKEIQKQNIVQIRHNNQDEEHKIKKTQSINQNLQPTEIFVRLDLKKRSSNNSQEAIQIKQVKKVQETVISHKIKNISNSFIETVTKSQEVTQTKNQKSQNKQQNQHEVNIVCDSSNTSIVKPISKEVTIPISAPVTISSIVSSTSTDKEIQKSVIKQVSPQINTAPKSNKISYKPINQVQLLVLQQNKVLTQKIQQLRKQRDNLLFSNKRFQIQLMQANNQDYYERQNNRLRKQVQSLQSINQQLKHNNFILQNKTKQFQSTDEVNKRQIKRILKQLQQLKLQSTKQRYQNKQKLKTLQQLIKTLQEHNKQLSDKFENYYNKNQQQQKIIKIKTDEQNKLKKLVQSYQTKYINLQKVQNQKRKVYELQMQKYVKQNSQLINNYRNYKRQSQAQVQNLKQNVKQLSLKRQSEVLLLQSRTKFLQKHNNTIQAQLQVVRLEQMVKQLKQQVQKRSNLIKQLNIKIDSMISMNDYQQLRKQFQLMNQINYNKNKQYQTKILVFGQQVNLLKNKIQQKDKKISQLSLNQGQKQQNSQVDYKNISNNSFKQILKQQIQQCDNMKQQIFKKNQLIFTLKQQLQQLNIKHSSLKNEHQILKKQHNSFENNSKIKKQILQQQLINQIQSYKRKLQVLDKKYQRKATANVDANYLLKELERVFLEKQKNNLIQGN